MDNRSWLVKVINITFTANDIPCWSHNVGITGERLLASDWGHGMVLGSGICQGVQSLADVINITITPDAGPGGNDGIRGELGRRLPAAVIDIAIAPSDSPR